MAGQDDNPLVKAESLIKRTLHRLGQRIDNRLFRESGSKLSQREISGLASLLEDAIESNLREDDAGIKRLAPDQYKVLLTFETRDRLGEGNRAALEAELTEAASEYVTNRRYHAAGRINVKVGFDVFVTTAAIQGGFNSAPSSAAAGDTDSPSPRTLHLKTRGGELHELRLIPGGGPAIIGRAAGVALRLDDESVSRHHCSLALSERGELVIADLGSANGTRLNRRLIDGRSALPLAQGDEIQVGDVELVLCG